MQHPFPELRKTIDAYLISHVPSEPKSLYAPVREIVAAGGKRIRPILTALTAQHERASNTHWLAAGAAIELLHTFTLVHDDIMDNAATRRGKPTLHVTYGNDAAILSGDVLIAMALHELSQTRSNYVAQMVEEFAKGFRLVCDGQALDKELEHEKNVTREAYLHMIDLKTAKILELAAVLGVYAGEPSSIDQLEAIRSFAHHLGIAFQIHDDLLDLTAEQASFGKTIGGDILEGKRTYLFVLAMERKAQMPSKEQALLERIEAHQATIDDIPAALDCFERYGILSETNESREAEIRKAQSELMHITSAMNVEPLRIFSEYLLSRSI